MRHDNPSYNYIFVSNKDDKMEEKESLSKLKLQQVESSFPTTKPAKNIISVNCPSCNTPPAVSNINIHDKIAKCESCATVFSFGEETVEDVIFVGRHDEFSNRESHMFGIKPRKDVTEVTRGD